MKKVDVAILMGSKSDLPIMEEGAKILKEFGVSYDIRVLSAHRTPKETCEYAENFRKNGGKIFICGAGVSAALAGVVSAHTTLPVIGVPIDSSSLKGLDSLLSIVQMPAGIPVATFAIGKAGAKNAALFVAAFLAIEAKDISSRLKKFRYKQAESVRKTKIKA